MDPEPTVAASTPVSLDHADFERIESDPDFRRLIADKVRFVAPAVLFFVVYYFLLPVLVGYAPRLMETKVIGDINLAYLFALSEFAMAWIIMALYVRRARAFDDMAQAIVARVRRGGRPS